VKRDSLQANKICTLREIEKIAAGARREGKRVVTTNGCFDILHVGHVRNLKTAKTLGDILIVGINSDASVRKHKGPSRPIIPARERAEMLASLASVDHVFIFSGRTIFSWVKKIKPNIHVKGGGADILAHPDFSPQKKVIEENGGKLVLIPHVKGKSTSQIIQKILKI